MKILVTGGSGFVGYHLAKRLVADGHEVTLVDNFFRGKRDKDFVALLEGPNITLVEADLTEPSAWEQFGDEFTHVYHLAAVNGTDLFYSMPQEVLRINILTLMHALEWLRTRNPDGKLLFTSSNEAYAGALEAFNQLPIPTPEDVPLVISDVKNPRWTYAATKLIGEQLCIHYATSYDLDMVIVRPHNFYGPRAGFNHVIPQFTKRIHDRVSPFPIYGADCTRTFCYIDDAIEAMVLVMEHTDTKHETYHIGALPEEEISMQILAEKLFSIAGWRPESLDIQNAPEGSVLRRAADINKIRQAVGFQPQVSLEEGLAKTFVWYVEHYRENQ